MSKSDWVSTSMPYLVPREKSGADPWSAETAAKGRRGTQRIAHAGEVSPPDEVAELLGLPDGEDVVVRRRVMYLDEQPCELTDTYYPSRIARGTPLAGTARIRGGAVTLLAELGHVGVRIREDVIARLPNAEEAETLRIEEGEPVLQLTRLTLDSEDRPIQVDIMAMPSQRQRLRYELRIG
ncbi:GntR family transcriptional regulator [Streptomyces sp. NPDC048639]|uniref:GntR family transcriptional regulator n=1 Tax=Streptomyces sp. NPDC048639 TaxID=3365581 RepID=UPI0037220907